MKKIIIISFVLLVSGCSVYWNKPGANFQQMSKDLADCRFKANQGGQKVYSALELEVPCMSAKGYELSPTAPAKK